ncbi:MAG: STAS domain-containing protein [Candidatus Omnitrophica bacterium]|nr:STAS domain-containing protein [Candidatus Omnitrophota bacterium]
MDIKLENIKDVALVVVGGKINMDNCNELRDAFKKILKEGKTKVLIDFNKVDFIDSSGIASLIEMFQNLEKVGGQMRLCHVNKNIIGLFEITKVHKLFGMFENREEALKEF